MPLLPLRQAVGKNCPNRADDVKAVHKRLMEIAKIPCYPSSGVMDDTMARGITDVQRHFMMNPDCAISVNGRTHRFLADWTTKPVSAGVQLPGKLKDAWEWVNPLLPPGSYCSSGYRSAEEQRRILQNFFRNTFKGQIIAKYGQTRYDAVSADLLANEAQVLEMVRGVGQAIAAPGKSMHQQGRAVDIGGPASIDATQVEVVKLVARAHAGLFNGTVLKERNGCVHFEIR